MPWIAIPDCVQAILSACCGSGSGSGPGEDICACVDWLPAAPATMFATIQNVSGCDCLDGAVINLTDSHNSADPDSAIPTCRSSPTNWPFTPFAPALETVVCGEETYAVGLLFSVYPIGVTPAPGYEAGQFRLRVVFGLNDAFPSIGLTYVDTVIDSVEVISASCDPFEIILECELEYTPDAPMGTPCDGSRIRVIITE